MEKPPMRRVGRSYSTYSAGSLTDDLRRVLRTELLKDSCSATTVARLFLMHRRTLNRHLRNEGLAFRQVANEVRFEIACELLKNTDMALSQIAAVLRYSELSAFTRAFRRWAKQTPSAWRANVPRSRRVRRRHKVYRSGSPADPEAVLVDKESVSGLTVPQEYLERDATPEQDRPR
ncbi:helix-turn-helix domain-containing protein [Microvirga solisilvae]|uniref:helix-turn-helix domain-containing protein n=1 Tax=Microvirga solisilvae TaxID=2919498 RepID=UPI001FAFFC7C|nr:AraC family transcriptional regulator [Microvirga solisilvae]